MYFTYVLQCKDQKLYIGFTENLKQRIAEHSSGHVTSTAGRRPFELIYYEACLLKKSAQDRERYFKTGFGRAFLKKRLNTGQ